MKNGTEINQRNTGKLCREIEETKLRIDNLTDAFENPM